MEKFNFKNVSDFVGMDFNAYLLTINKKNAEELLSASIGNRNLNKDNLLALIRDMNNGEYEYKTPGSGIAFNTAGELVNGHHTLTAFISSNLNVITVVLFTGAEGLDKCDTGKTRTLADSAIMSGNGNCKKICKLSGNILRIKYGIPLTNSGMKKAISNSEIFEFCNNNYDKLIGLYNDIYRYKDRIRKKNEGIGKYPKAEESVIGSIMWELIYNEGFNYDMVTDFAFGVITLNSHPNIIVDRFRKQIIKDTRLTSKNGGMDFEDFRSAFKDKFYKYAKSLTKNVA